MPPRPSQIFARMEVLGVKERLSAVEGEHAFGLTLKTYNFLKFFFRFSALKKSSALAKIFE